MQITTLPPIAVQPYGALQSEELSPHSKEAEQATLGSMLINGEIIHDLKGWFQPHYFYLLQHQWIYEAMLSLAHRGESVDNITVIEELKSRNQLAKIHNGRGEAYMTLLINSVDHFFNVGSYARTVKEYWKRRRLLALATQLAQTSVTLSSDGSESGIAKRIVAETVELMNDPYDPETDGLRKYLIHAKDLSGMPDITWLIPGEIPERGLTVVYGPSGVGKSFFVLDYAMRVAQIHVVLYVAAEGESGFKMRVAAWAKHNRQEFGELNFYLNVAALLDDGERRAFVSQIVDFLKPKLIILDTVAHCMLPGDENSTRDMGFFLRAAKEIQKDYDCAVLLVHHTNKEGNVERGSGALRGASDSMIKLSGDDDLIMVECSKSKDASPFETRYIKLLPIEVSTDPDGNPVFSPVVIAADKVQRTKHDPVTNRQRLILETIADLFMEDGAIINDLVELTKVPRPSLFRTMNEMKKIELVTQSGKGEPYFITPDGLSAIGRNKPVSLSTQSQKSMRLDLGTPADNYSDESHESHESHSDKDKNIRDSVRLVRLGQHDAINDSETESETHETCPVCAVRLNETAKGWQCPDCHAIWKH